MKNYRILDFLLKTKVNKMTKKHDKAPQHTGQARQENKNIPLKTKCYIANKVKNICMAQYLINQALA